MSPGPFDEYREQQARADRMAARNRDAFEARSLEFLLHRFGMMPRAGRELRRSFERRTGRYLLRFSEFHREYSTFPLVLGTTRISGLHTDPACLLSNLFRGFDRAPFVAAYETFFERAEPLADGRPIGLVFPYKGIVRGLVIHDAADLDHRVFCGLSLVYQASRRAHYRRLVVQPFQTLVEGLHNDGHGWRP